MSPSSFGALLRRQRLAAGLTQEALAEAAGLSARGIQDLERGVNVTPRAETVRLLTEALGLNAEDRASMITAARPELGTPPSEPVPQRARSVPIAPTALIGREHDVVAIEALLRSNRRPEGARLVTLTGPGGVGKSRLAAAVALAASECFDEAVWVELAPVQEPALVADAIGRALAVRADDDHTLLGELARAVGGRQLLLVLDNFEHVLAAAPMVADLLAGAPEMVVLATSRAPLRIRGERERPVEPLAVDRGLPAASEGARGDDIAAVTLFEVRAADVVPGFSLDSRNTATIVEICRRLDGLPLAIELAAARLKVLPAEALLARLERRLPLLTGGPRDAPARQRTMRDTIAWSYDLLAPDEQQVFRGLAVFSGGFTLEAAEVPVTDLTQRRDPEAVLDIVASLADQSLLRQVAQPGPDPRFSLLETVLEFAQERLVAEQDADAAHRAHAIYFMELAERAEPELTGPDQALWLDRLESEHANLRAAITWALAQGELAVVRRCVGALWHFWQVRGHVAEGRAWAEAGLEADGEPTADRARALRAAALLAEYHGDYDHAVARHEAAAAAWRALGDERNLARTLDHLGNCAHDRGDFGRATDLHEQALALSRRVDDPRGVASSLGNLGIMAIHLGDLERARERLEEALAVLRELHHRHGVGVALSNLGVVAMRQGDLARAVTLHEEALALWRELGDQDEMATAMVSLGEVARLAGASDLARAHLQEGLRLFTELGNRRAMGIALAGLANVAEEADDGQGAAATFAAALALSVEVDDQLNVADCFDGLARAAVREGRPEEAARLLGAAEALRDDSGAPVAAHLRPRYDEVVAEVRAAVADPGAFAATWDAGRRLSRDQAAAEAREVAKLLS